jgi:hypothetical protein
MCGDFLSGIGFSRLRKRAKQSPLAAGAKQPVIGFDPVAVIASSAIRVS